MSSAALGAALFAAWGKYGGSAVDQTAIAALDAVTSEEFARLRADNADLQRQVAELTASLKDQVSLARHAHGRNDDTFEALLERVSALELRLGELDDGMTPEERAEVAMERRRALLEPHSADGTSRPPAGETYENDDGIPLVQYAERMSDAVHASYDEIDVMAMDCRETACKVVYAPVDADNDFSIATMLGMELVGVNFRVRYDRDDYGNHVAYIELDE